MMKSTLTYIYIFLFFAASSQNSESIWSREHKIDGYERILGVHENNVFLQRCLRGYFEDRKYSSELARYDSTGKVTHIIGVEDLETRDYQELYAVNTDKGIAVIYLTTDPKADKYFLLSAQMYSHEDLTPYEIRDLMQVRYRRIYKPRIKDFDTYNSLIDIDFELSEDKSKLAIIYSEERIGKEKYSIFEYTVFDLTDGMKRIHDGYIETEGKSDLYINMDIAVSNIGDFAMLLKEYREDRNLEFYGKNPSYKYSIYYEPRSQEPFIYDIPIKKYFVDEMRLAISDYGDVYLTGLLRNKPGNNVYGTVFTKLKAEGNLDFYLEDTFSKKEIKTIRLKDKDRLQDEYEVVDIRITDNIVFGVYQYSNILQDRDESRLNNRFAFGQVPTRINEYYHKQNLFVHGFDLASGDRKWTVVNPRRQSDYDDYEYFTFGNLSLYKGNLFMVYNESLDNHSRVRIGKAPKTVWFPRQRTTVTMVKITPRGVMSDQLLSSEDHYYVPYQGFYINHDELILLKMKKNYKQFNLGRISLH